MKDMNQRVFITLALTLAVWWGYELVFRPKPVPHAAGVAATTAPASPAAAVPPPSDPRAPSAVDVPRGTSPAGAPRPAGHRVTLDTARLHLVLTSDGAAIEQALLKGDKFKRHTEAGRDEAQVNLVASRAGEPLPLSTVVKSASGTVLVPADAAYEVLRHDDHSATFRAQVEGVTVLKTLTVDTANYRLDLNVEVRAAAALAGHLDVLIGGHGEAPSGGLFGSRSSLPARTICAAGSKIERVAVGAKTPFWDGPGAVEFAGIDEQYFLAAVVPPAQPPATCHLEARPDGALVSTVTTPVSVGAANASTLAFTVYLGPKDTEELSAVAKPLRHAIDFGFWSIIADVLLGVMRFFYKVVPGHNWGIAIILLTVSMKILTFPLQHKSMKSMQEMQRIQPQLEEMKKKFAGDTQRQNVEQMKLFKEHGVNPMGSCLPMLIQMPIWFALYTTLQVSVELYNSVFIPGWLTDLTAKDPYYILPVAMGATMILTQVLTPAPMSNPSQKTMGYAMSGFFSLLMMTLPSGLTLYIFVNNVLSITQQMYLRRTMKPPSPPARGQTVAIRPQRV